MKKLIILLISLCFCFVACTSSQDTPVTSGENPVTEFTSDPVPPTPNQIETPSVSISPLLATIDLTKLTDCSIAISLEKGNILPDDTGTIQMTVSAYVYDLYDAAALSQLKPGDIIVIRQQDVVVTSLEYNSYGNLLINGGLDLGGYELRTDENAVYYEIGYSDIKSWQSIGKVTIPVSPDFVYTDCSDLDSEPHTYSLEDFLNANDAIDYHFTPHNTIIVIENGIAVSMERRYTP